MIQGGPFLNAIQYINTIQNRIVLVSQFEHKDWDSVLKKAEEGYHTSAPGRTRTCGTGIRNPKLYPLSYRRNLNEHSDPDRYQSQNGVILIPFFPPPVNCSDKITTASSPVVAGNRCA
jgi:hypothetical protein